MTVTHAHTACVYASRLKKLCNPTPQLREVWMQSKPVAFKYFTSFVGHRNVTKLTATSGVYHGGGSPPPNTKYRGESIFSPPQSLAWYDLHIKLLRSKVTSNFQLTPLGELTVLPRPSSWWWWARCPLPKNPIPQSALWACPLPARDKISPPPKKKINGLTPLATTIGMRSAHTGSNLTDLM